VRRQESISQLLDAIANRIIFYLGRSMMANRRQLLSVVPAFFVALAVPSVWAQRRERSEIVVNVAPPAARQERVPPPRRGYVWAPGYWRWEGRRHVWVAGHWVKARRGYHWAAPRWDEREGRHQFQQGRWERD
jgi:hypothetical protein